MWQPKYSAASRPGTVQADQPSPTAPIAPAAPGRPALRETLSDRAKALMNALPAPINVAAIALDYPHVMNRIANAWSEPRQTEQLIMNLLIDHRGDREGFPFAVADALTDIRLHRQAMAQQEAALAPRRR